MTNIFYAGIGSRQTPENILEIMEDIAKDLGFLRFILRSGGAGGADSAFEKGALEANGKTEIYLPWKNFRSKNGICKEDISEALIIAELFHPSWQWLSTPARKLMARNTFQVLSLDETIPNSSFVVCWTPGGGENKTTKDDGGTGQCIRIAKAYNIPVFNLKNEDALERLYCFLNTLV